MYEQTGNKWYPHRCSHLAQYVIQNQRGIINENESFQELSNYQSVLKSSDCRSDVNIKIGSKVAIIQSIPYIHDRVIELQGFKTPKKIKNIHTNNDDNIEWLEFDDGSTYPDKHFIEAGQGGGELEGTSTLFFPNKKSAEYAITMSGLAIPTDWKILSTNLNP